MTTENVFSDPTVQKIIAGAICGILVGVSHRVSRRFFEVAAAIAAIFIIYLLVTTDGQLVDQVAITRIKDFLAKWVYELGGFAGGVVVGYSLVERSQSKGK